MDQDGSLNISFDEWRDFLLLAPSTDIHDLIKFWRHSTVSIYFYATIVSLFDSIDQNLNTSFLKNKRILKMGGRQLG